MPASRFPRPLTALPLRGLSRRTPIPSVTAPLYPEAMGNLYAPNGYVDAKEFAVAVRPMVETADRLICAYLALGPKYAFQSQVPAVHLDELDAEPLFTQSGWNEPVATAHSLLALLNAAGVDHLRGFAQLFTSGGIPVYSGFVLARAALEAFSWAWWLGDPEISVQTRVIRSQLLRLNDAHEMKRAGDRLMKKEGRKRDRQIKEGLPTGWSSHFRQPAKSANLQTTEGGRAQARHQTMQINGEQLPSTRSVVGKMLNFGPSSPLWSIFCGMAHATPHALLPALDPIPPDLKIGKQIFGLTISARSVEQVGAIVLRASLEACGAHVQLRGWADDPEWRLAVQGVTEFLVRSASSVGQELPVHHGGPGRLV